MPSAMRHTVVRRIARALGVALLFVVVWQTWLLYAHAAPFHQLYTAATEPQNRAVTWRILLAVAGPPIAVALLCVAGFTSPPTRGPRRRFAFTFAVVCLLSGLHAAAIRWCLPYGFGSGYEHASDSQHLHLTIAGAGGLTALSLSVVLATLGFAARSSRRSALHGA